MDEAGVGSHEVLFAYGFFEGYAYDVWVVIGYHLAEASLHDEFHGTHAEFCCQDAVESYGGAATLEVAEDGIAYVVFDAGCLEVCCQLFAYATEFDMLVAHFCWGASHHCAALWHGAFSHHDDAVAATLVVTLFYFFFDSVDVVGYLGDEAHVGAACDGGVECYPSCVAPHDLEDEYAVVAGGSGDEFVDSVGAYLHGRLESECVVGEGEVVVYCFGYADDVESFFCEAEADALAAVAADVDDGVDAHVLQFAQHLVAAVHGGP